MRTSTLKRTVAEFGSDGGTDLAAALTYYSVLALCPAQARWLSIPEQVQQLDNDVVWLKYRFTAA